MSDKSAYRAVMILDGAAGELDPYIYASEQSCAAAFAGRERAPGVSYRCAQICICYLYRQAIWHAFRRGRVRWAARLLAAGAARYWRDNWRDK